MARTKQSAAKSTGGKVPKKTLITKHSLKNMVTNGFVVVSRNRGGSDLGPSRYDKFGGIRNPLTF